MRNANRIDAALKKLYVAFHENQLHPECCNQCAVGNILDNTDSWKHLSDHHGSVELNYIGNVHQSIGRKFNGYSPLELLKIEATFLKACGYTLPLHHKNKKPENPTDKEVLFYGLCAVVKFLCELDNIPDALEDYTKLFEYEEQKKELVAVA
ncbi:Na(+)-translocating NADH-quinone reductase subunit F [Yeosuana marina]|uniref:Na(+)-translocating NADH-quinone reductase subunit F n=1 Tax=Yeosuana marina TaxID=1565536 RepID=UPI0014243B67|nr:Na(+)-translocating NADH-quinone reductase subunit F [Yeosuana marina]